jgi:hypothetical protein
VTRSRTALTFADPPPTGYLHLAARVAGTTGSTPLPRRSHRKRDLLNQLKVLAAELGEHPEVTRAIVYRAILVPPPSRAARQQVPQLADYDVAVLVETPDLDDSDSVRRSMPYQNMRAALADSGHPLETAARCLRYVADVDKDRPGLFLFNYFAATDVRRALDVWESMARWYAAETKLNNSTLLQPVETAPYVFVNHARWARSLPSFAATQATKRSFRTEVLDRLRQNQVAAMPILFRLA